MDNYRMAIVLLAQMIIEHATIVSENPNLITAGDATGNVSGTFRENDG